MSGRKVVTPSFEILRNGGVLKVVPVRKAKLIVGSDTGVDLRLKHSAIAGRHLEIAVVAGRYLEARNLAGPGRLSLAGEPVDVVRLREGDELNLGPVALRLTYNNESKSAVPQARRAAPQERRAVPQPPPAHDEPTDGVQFASFRSPTPESHRGGPALIQDEPTVDGPLTEAPTQTMRAFSRENDAPTEAMPALPRPEPGAPPTTPPAPAVAAHPEVATPVAASGALVTEPGLEGIVLTPPVAIVMSWGGSGSRHIPLRVGSFEIGSGRCALHLDHPGVAPTHATVMVMPDGAIYLRHLAGSAHRTLKDGLPVNYVRWLPTENVQIGPVTLRLDSSPETTSAVAMPEVPGPPSLGGLQSMPPRTAFDEDSTDDVAPPFGSPFPHQSPPTPLPRVPEAPAPSPVSLRGAVSTPPVTPPKSPAAASLVKVRRKSEPSAPVMKDQEADLYVDDIEVDYRAPLWQRAALPAVVAVLLAVIVFQFWAYNRPTEGPTSTGPRVASGQAPDLAGLQVDRAGGGTMVVGDPRRPSRGGGRTKPVEYLGSGNAGGYGGASAYINPADDWSPKVEGRTYDSHGASAGQGQRATAQRVDSSADAAAVDQEEEEAYYRERDRAKAAKAGTRTEEQAPRTTSAGGWVEMKDVEAVIYQDSKKLRYCYSTARETHPRLAGVMWLKLTLSEDGRIRQAAIEGRSTVGHDGLFKCLRRQLSTMVMPVPEGGPVSFSYPFELTQ